MPRFYKFEYAIMNADGDIVDSSDGAEPLSFVEGDGRVIRGLEQALRNKEQGDEFDVTIGPEDAYGVDRLPQHPLGAGGIANCAKDHFIPVVRKICKPGECIQVAVEAGGVCQTDELGHL